MRVMIGPRARLKAQTVAIEVKVIGDTTRCLSCIPFRITAVVVDPVWAVVVVRTVVVVVWAVVVVVGAVVVIELTVVVVIRTGVVRRDGCWLWGLNLRKHLCIDWGVVSRS